MMVYSTDSQYYYILIHQFIKKRIIVFPKTLLPLCRTSLSYAWAHSGTLSCSPPDRLVKVEGDIPQADLAKLRKGVTLDDGQTTARAKVKLKGIEGNIYSYDVTIFEGKNREIRRMFAAIGKEVIFLKRVAIGDLRLGGLGRGASRYLTDKEINYLKNL